MRAGTFGCKLGVDRNRDPHHTSKTQRTTPDLSQCPPRNGVSLHLIIHAQSIYNTIYQIKASDRWMVVMRAASGVHKGACSPVFASMPTVPRSQAPAEKLLSRPEPVVWVLYP